MGRVSGRKSRRVRLLEAYVDGWAVPSDHILREGTEKRRSANGERDEQHEPSSAADEQRDDDQNAEGMTTALLPSHVTKRIASVHVGVRWSTNQRVMSESTSVEPSDAQRARAEAQHDDERERDGEGDGQSEHDAASVMYGV